MEHNISFPSKAENLTLVEKIIDEICDRYKVNEDFYGNILIALTEAVNNAIHHGNKSNPNKKVHLVTDYSEGVISFSIEDEGPGFDYINLPDPTDPRNIEKPHCRGVFLMKKLCHNIEFLNDGSLIKLYFDTNNDLELTESDEKNESKP